ncbi:SDR family NAD(P)-dependent oxidoreductase [Oscillospiraceae bacterium HV4-5-C5C]|nr:SDR family NAD(P)-dependent oxidoreductase [Oscillospiraceae bacterium HV4-5-C5C]
MKCAIISGASSGLGAAFVKAISAQKVKPDEIWVIARRRERLAELAGQVSCPVRILALDLTRHDDLELLRQTLADFRPEVRILVNAAGYGRIGDCQDSEAADQAHMIDLNCRALVQVTQLILPYMSKQARILQIASVAAYQPLPGLAVYAASKSFVLSYSRALRWELFPRGIHVTAVCPYWIKDTEFIPVARQGAQPGQIRHFPLAGRSRWVVARALFDSRLNLPVCTPDLQSLLLRILDKFIPHEISIAGWVFLRRL